MEIELSEVLACPRCGPPQGLVVLVDEMEDGRVRTGHLGCSRCEERYPLREGRVWLAEPGEGEEPETGEPAAGAGSAPDGELAVEVAALLDARSASGYLLLDEELGRLAPRVAGLSEGAEVLALEPRVPAGPGVSPARVPAGSSLPVLDGKLGGAALWRPDAGRVRDAFRCLSAEARVAGLRPGAAVREALGELPGEVLASEERAFVVRRG